MNKRKIGTEKETAVVQFLESKKVRITDRNFRSRKGEIDIIGYEGDTLVFFEVKYRRIAENGFAGEAVGLSKQKTICRVSDYYRMLHNISDFSPCRYDVITIDGERVDWIKNAFYYIPAYR